MIRCVRSDVSDLIRWIRRDRYGVLSGVIRCAVWNVGADVSDPVCVICVLSGGSNVLDLVCYLVCHSTVGSRAGSDVLSDVLI